MSDVTTFSYFKCADDLISSPMLTAVTYNCTPFCFFPVVPSGSIIKMNYYTEQTSTGLQFSYGFGALCVCLQ